MDNFWRLKQFADKKHYSQTDCFEKTLIFKTIKKLFEFFYFLLTVLL